MQEYTDEFHKMALMLDVPLTTQETLMKYIVGFPSYIRNIVFMFGPTNLDEVFVQETYIEAGKTGVGVSGESSFRKTRKTGKTVAYFYNRLELLRLSPLSTSEIPLSTLLTLSCPD